MNNRIDNIGQLRGTPEYERARCLLLEKDALQERLCLVNKMLRQLDAAAPGITHSVRTDLIRERMAAELVASNLARAQSHSSDD
ncbi:MAG: hypothetical protein V4805_04140 [Pseudomonadota bacterium]